MSNNDWGQILHSTLLKIKFVSRNKDERVELESEVEHSNVVACRADMIPEDGLELSGGDAGVAESDNVESVESVSCDVWRNRADINTPHAHL